MKRPFIPSREIVITEMPPLLYDVKGAARMLCLGEKKIYLLVRQGRLKYLKVGRGLRFNLEQLQAFAHPEDVAS